MSTSYSECVVEEATLEWLAGLGYAVARGPEVIETDRSGNYGGVVLAARLRAALLPKLIRGELRGPDAERIVGRTV